MPDITMCTGKDCEKKKDCYRYMAPPSKYQSMSDFENREEDCQYFWEIDPAHKVIIPENKK